MPQFCESLTNTATNCRTCYKQIRWPHTSNILDTIFHWISAAYFCLQNFNKKLIKEINVLEIFVKEQCFEKKCFDNKKWKEFSSVMDRPMFLTMNINHLGWPGMRNLIEVFFKCFHWLMLAFWQIDMCNDWKNQLSAAASACDFQKVYLRSIPCCNNC